MKLKIILHSAEEGGFWAEVPAILGCATQGDTLEALFDNLREVVEGCLSVDLEEIKLSETDKILEIAV
ncbi:antitoxin HicB [Gammaproteobacteria bacterium]